MHQSSVSVSRIVLATWYAFVGVEPALVRAPENTAVTQGSDVTLYCTSNVNNSFLIWFNQSCSRYDSILHCSAIYNGYNNPSNDRFTMTASNNATHVTRDLNIRQTQPTDAGLYVCVENIPSHGVQEIHSAQLVVLGKTNVPSAALQWCSDYTHHNIKTNLQEQYMCIATFKLIL